MKFRVCLETLGKKFILEVDLGINFVKVLLKKLKNCIKNRESKKVTNILFVTNKIFWNSMIPFLVNKGSLNRCQVVIRK